jgi:hypothetical protein
MKLKSKTPTFKTVFLQKWGTFSNETMVCVGVTKSEILADMKRLKVKPELIEAFTRKVGGMESKAAFVWTPPGTGATLLWMDSWSNVAEDMCTLVHETNHLIYDISRDKGFRDEPEIQAYQQEYLFRGIIAELQKRRKKFLGVKSKSSKRKHGNENPQGADDRVPHVQSRFDRITKEISGSEVQVPRNA